ncbi:hypothetical protein AB0I84_10515 [Streptomyces spectabilis]|uniref:hypothetical protein n=1 Tax=Streptomyces spectabilis TaxID=68270 RepID=UPI0033E9767D
MWRITLWHPDLDSGECTYLVPHRQARTEVVARAVATDRHADQAAVMSDPVHAMAIVVGEVAFLPAVCSRDRAAAWVALVKHDAITEHGWARLSPAGQGGRDELWRQQVRDTHQRLRERVIGFGASLSSAMSSAAAAGTAWDLDAYRDQFGRIRWDDVRADVHRAAQTHIWHTPFGVAWIDLG